MTIGTRPRLLAGLHIVAVDDGAHVLSRHGGSLLRGGEAYSWLARLAPRLTGECTVAQLCAGLDAGALDAVAGLVEQLYDHGLAYDATDRAATAFGYATRETRPAVATDTMVVAFGSGELFAAWTPAARAAGFTRLVPAGDVDQRLVRAAGLVVHIAGRVPDTRADDVDRWCAEAGTPLLTVARIGDGVWFVPSRAGLRWADFERRVLGLGARSADGGPLRPEVAALAAGQIAQACARLLAAPADERPWVLRATAGSLHERVHHPLPHPLTRPAGPVSETEFLTRTESAAPAEDFAHRAAPCGDLRTGIVGEVTERFFAGPDVRVSRIVVADAVGSPRRDGRAMGEPSTVLAAGTDFAAVRELAMRRGLEAYAARAVDPRRFGDQDRLWGLDVLDRTTREIPASDVFPCLGRDGGPLSAVGSGDTWDAAVSAALRGICVREAVSALASRRAPCPRADLAKLASDPAIARLIEVAGEGLAVHDIRSSLGIPVYAFCLGAETFAYTCADDPAVAIHDGLVATVLAEHVRVAGRLEFAPAPVRRLPQELRGADAEDPQWTSEADIRKALSGHRPVAAALDHDPAVWSALSAVVRVLVPRAKGQW